MLLKRGLGWGNSVIIQFFYIKKMLFGYKETGAASILMLRAYVDHIK